MEEKQKTDTVSRLWMYATIILAFLLIAETAVVGFLFKIGMEEIDREKACRFDCSLMDSASSYVYSDGICSCLDAQGYRVHSEKMR